MKTSQQQRETVLLVEDDPDVAHVVRMVLERSGFAVDWCVSGEDALERIRRGGIDLALVDIILPGMDGRDLCRSIRANSRTETLPVILLTSLTEDANIVVGLGAGADDYVKKPFSNVELSARVRAALRRGRMSRPRRDAEDSTIISVGGITMDTQRHVVTADGARVPLTLAEFRLLQYLMENQGRAFTRAELLKSIVGDGAQVIERNVDVHVRNIRRKIAARSRYIVTVRGIGYRFDAELTNEV